MSHFICGKLTFRQLPPPEDPAIFFDLVRVGAEHKVNVEFDCNIVQSIVYELIGEPVGDDSVPFLITDSPLADTSDELIAPDTFLFKGDDCYAVLRRTFTAIQALLATALGSGQFSSILVFFSESEGLGGHYPTVKSGVADFVDVCTSHFPECGTVPNLRVSVVSD